MFVSTSVYELLNPDTEGLLHTGRYDHRLFRLRAG